MRTDSLATATFGRRYVFADVDQSTLSLDTRVNWTFTPDLSLQVYAQPFVAAGDFDHYKEFLRPGSYDFAVYGRDAGTLTAEENGFTADPDGAGPATALCRGPPLGAARLHHPQPAGQRRAALGVPSRLHAVLRLAAAARPEYERGEFEFVRDLPAVFTEPARNIFVIKATYWLSR